MKSADKKTIPAKNGLPAYTLIRSDRRSMQIQIMPFSGEVIIRVPRRTAQKTADAFLKQNLSAVLDAITRAKTAEPGKMQNTLSSEHAKMLKQQAASYIPERVRHWTDKLGLPMPVKISYTAAQKRFGSCRKYPDGRVHLCFSYRLMQYPRDAIDAVVLHEVAHMRYLNHSDAFYALILMHMPDYRIRHAALKES